MEKTKELKLPGNESGDQHSTVAGRESTTNTDLTKMKATILEEHEEHNANQETRSPPKLGVVSKIGRIFGSMDEEMAEPNQRFLSLMFQYL